MSVAKLQICHNMSWQTSLFNSTGGGVSMLPLLDIHLTY